MSEYPVSSANIRAVTVGRGIRSVWNFAPVGPVPAVETITWTPLRDFVIESVVMFGQESAQLGAGSSRLTYLYVQMPDMPSIPIYLVYQKYGPSASLDKLVYQRYPVNKRFEAGTKVTLSQYCSDVGNLVPWVNVYWSDILPGTESIVSSEPAVPDVSQKPCSFFDFLGGDCHG